MLRINSVTKNLLLYWSMQHRVERIKADPSLKLRMTHRNGQMTQGFMSSGAYKVS